MLSLEEFKTNEIENEMLISIVGGMTSKKYDSSPGGHVTSNHHDEGCTVTSNRYDTELPDTGN